MYRDPVETGRKNRDAVMSRGGGEVGVGFLLTGSGFWWPSRLPRPVVWDWDPGGSGLAFLCLSAPSAAGEASVLAHTKRAGRVGVGESGLGGWALGTVPSRGSGR